MPAPTATSRRKGNVEAGEQSDAPVVAGGWLRHVGHATDRPLDSPLAVAPFQLDYDPMDTDPGRWGHSLGNLGELVFACLDAAAPRSLVEVGAYAGDVTGCWWRGRRGRRPRRWCRSTLSRSPRWWRWPPSTRNWSWCAGRASRRCPDLAPADAYIIDGDHNYYTVSEELRLIDAPRRSRLPLLLCHDVCWPHARRDAYYTPEAIPDEHRQPIGRGRYLFPGVSGLSTMAGSSTNGRRRRRAARATAC